ncbi:hypothetical protein MUK42_36608 [Musa troglodytarum]|uniref:DUF569 domain-containing protein n=1 Tax=Musa troglodytarum TaxID=320322 RepID=A0A9E7FLS6_9LILI|nr:hypothetical protein MUK42_36608 [Musa troglodytarum]
MLECTHHLVVFNANSRGAYESLAGARVVRLRTIHDKYLTVDDDMLGLRQQHDGSLVRAWWSVESITDNRNQLRLRFQNCFGVHLAATLTDFTLQRLSEGKGALRGPPAGQRHARCPQGVGADPRGLPGHAQVQLRPLSGVRRPSSCKTLDQFLWHIEILESASSNMVAGGRRRRRALLNVLDVIANTFLTLEISASPSRRTLGSMKPSPRPDSADLFLLLLVSAGPAE